MAEVDLNQERSNRLVVNLVVTPCKQTLTPFLFNVTFTVITKSLQSNKQQDPYSCLSQVIYSRCDIVLGNAKVTKSNF